MAEYLSKAGLRAVLGGLLVFGAAASAQSLPDPTRPPPAADAANEPAAGNAGGPVLQSVLVSPTRRIAVINGQVLRQGDKFGDARVAKITEGEVVLRNGQEVRVLKLFPQVEKHVDSSRSHAAGDHRQR